MNKATRMLVTTSMAIVAGATMGVGQASASAKTPQAPVAAEQSAQQAGNWGGDRVVGYFRSPRFCIQNGRLGEFRGRWDDFRCVYQRRGFNAGYFALVVSWDRGSSWNDFGHNNGWNDDRGHHHGWNDNRWNDNRGNDGRWDNNWNNNRGNDDRRHNRDRRSSHHS